MDHTKGPSCHHLTMIGKASLLTALSYYHTALHVRILSKVRSLFLARIPSSFYTKINWKIKLTPFKTTCAIFKNKPILIPFRFIKRAARTVVQKYISLCTQHCTQARKSYLFRFFNKGSLSVVLFEVKGDLWQQIQLFKYKFVWPRGYAL